MTQRAIWRGTFSSVRAGGFRAAMGADRPSQKGLCLQWIKQLVAALQQH